MKSLEELQAIRSRMKVVLMNRGVVTAKDISITVGMSGEAVAAGARELMALLPTLIEESKLSNIKFMQSGAINMAQQEPVVEVVMPNADKVTYVKVDAAKLKEIFASHVVGGKPVSKYTLGEGR